MAGLRKCFKKGPLYFDGLEVKKISPWKNVGKNCQGKLENMPARVGPVTRRKLRDETRSRRQVTRRDEIRDHVHKNQNFTQNFDPTVVFCLFYPLFFKTISRDQVTRRDKIEMVSSRLVSRFFETVSLPALCQSNFALHNFLLGFCSAFEHYSSSAFKCIVHNPRYVT